MRKKKELISNSSSNTFKENLWTASVIMVGAIVLYTGSIYYSDVMERRKSEIVYENLASQMRVSEAITDDSFSNGVCKIEGNDNDLDISSVKEVSTKNNEKQVLDSLVSIYAENTDTAGWIKAGDKIDYPVMKCLEEKDFYLYNAFSKQESISGALYLSEESEIGQRGINVIYGHHMKDDSMFGSLDKYLNNEYLEANKTIEIDSLYEEGLYEVVAVFRSQIYSSEDNENFKYYAYKGDVSEDDFNFYTNGVSNFADYSDLSEVYYGDSLVELVTCAYHVENGRLVLVCKKVQ